MQGSDQTHNGATAPIAVVIPCHNYGRFLADAVKSVLAQKVRPDEIVVVDDGSTDNTADVCRGFAELAYLRTDQGGPSAARNAGLARTRSPMLLFLDADDMLRPFALEALHEAIQQAPSAGAVIGVSDTFQDSSPQETTGLLPDPAEVRTYAQEALSPGVSLLSARVLERFVRSNIAPACSTLIRRSVFETVGPWNEKYRHHEDREMWIRIAAKCRLAFLDRPVALVRRHGQNITDHLNWERNHQGVLEVLDDLFRADWPDRSLKAMLRRQYAVGAYHLAQRLADRGCYSQAAALMRASLRRDPARVKNWALWMAYGLKGLIRPDMPDDPGRI